MEGGCCVQQSPLGEEGRFMDERKRVDLKEYLESLEDVADPFEDIPVPADREAETPENPTEPERLAAYIRMRSKGAQLACRSVFAAELAFDDTVDIDQTIADMMADQANADIRVRKGKRNDYYYATEFMTDNFAMIAALVLDKDIPRAIADMVRFNEKTYHLPTPAMKFTKYPYNYTKVQVEQAIVALLRQPENGDIGTVVTGNKKTYLFHNIEAMPERLAKALAEDSEKDEFGKYWQ